MEHLNNIQLFAVWILPIIFAVTIHEAAHGYVAKLFGDKTAMIMGRLTLNPLRHIDLLGTIIVPLITLLFAKGIIFGWAKPVPINPQNFQRPRRDMAMVACAGPMSNLIMALMWAGIAKLGLILLQHGFPGSLAISYMGQAGISINLILGVLNILPFPPLDGGHIVLAILPKKVALKLSRVAGIGLLLLMLLIIFGLWGIIISPVVEYLYNLVVMIFGL